MIHVLAWVTLPLGAPEVVPLLSGVAGALALGGVVASAQGERVVREIGWTAQTVSIAVLAISWLVAAAA